jgi:hypothetical protein
VPSLQQSIQEGGEEEVMPLPPNIGSTKGLFLAGEDVAANGCIAVILEEPRIVPSNFPNPDGSQGQRCRVTIKLPSGKKKVWTMNNTTYKLCITKFGLDEKKWIDKKIKLNKSRAPVNGVMRDVIYGEPA